MRVWYELRVRELIAGQYVKKSKFYEVKRPSDAVDIYEKRVKVPHTIMWCEKDRRHSMDRLAFQASDLYAEICRERRAEKVSGSLGHTFKEFLTTPGALLGELSGNEKEVRSERIIKRRSYGKSQEEAAY